MRVARVAGLFAVGLVVVSSSVLAQNRGSGGVWLGGGVGIGSAALSCNICNGPLAQRQTVTSAQLRVGGTASRQILFGLEANGWRKTNVEEEVTQTFVGIGGVLYWYPSPRKNYYIKAGLGPVIYRATDANVGPDEEAEAAVESTAFGGHFGFGYDLRVADNILFVPFFNFTGTLYSNLSSDGQQLTRANPTLIQVGLGLTLLR
jgi:hypothetical protein